MTPFYLFMGVLFVYIYKKNINLKKSKKFFIIFLFLFILSPITYAIFQLQKKIKELIFQEKKSHTWFNQNGIITFQIELQ